MQSSPFAILASLGRLAFTAAVVAGAGAVIGLGFVDPAGAAESAAIVADHGYLDWLILTAALSPAAGLAVAWRRFRRERRREARERETVSAEARWSGAYERAHGYPPVSDSELFHWSWRAVVMARMSMASRDRPRLAVLFPSLFTEELR